MDHEGLAPVDSHALLALRGQIPVLVLGKLHLSAPGQHTFLRVVPEHIHGHGAVRNHDRLPASALANRGGAASPRSQPSDVPRGLRAVNGAPLEAQTSRGRVEIDTADFTLRDNENALPIGRDRVGHLVVAGTGKVAESQSIHEDKAAFPVSTGRHQDARFGAHHYGTIVQDGHPNQVVRAGGIGPHRER